MKLIPLIFFLIFSTMCLHAQQLRFEAPKKLSKDVNSSAEESAPILSPDKSSLYFVRTLHKKNTGGKYAGQDVWMALKEEDQYKHIHNNFPLFNTEGNNAVLGFSKDGKKVYLLNAYSDGNSTEPGISVSYKSESGWSVPELLNLPKINTNDLFYTACLNEAENVIIVSKEGKDAYGKEDLYVSKKNKKGEWSAFANLGKVINTDSFEMSPFLSDNGKTLFFSSKGHGGHGDADVFMSTRLDDSWIRWSEPVNLGPEINSSAFDAYFSLTPDSSVYFASSRNNSLADIYLSRLLPAKIEKKPVIETPIVEEETREEQDLQSVVEIDRKDYEKMKSQPQLQETQQLYFDFDKYFLRELSLSSLEELALKIKGQPGVSIKLVGHTDDIGSNEYNIVLSQKRALATQAYLIKLGIPADSINTYWFGENKPVAGNSTPESRQKNRRVEVFVNQEGVSKL